MTFPEAIADERALRRPVDIRFHDKRIRSTLLGRLRLQAMPFRHDQVTELLDRPRFQLAEVVTNTPPREAAFVAPIPDSHDVPQRPMLFGQVLQFVVIEIATQPYGRQDQNLPVIHPFSSHIVARGPD